MPAETLRAGDATVTITGLSTIEGIITAALESAAVKVLRAEAERVAEDARSKWYGAGGVRRQTGRSGDIRVYVRATASEIIVGVGSTDTRTTQGRAPKRPLPTAIHAPGPFAKKPGTGEFLLPKLVVTPFRRRVKIIVRDIATETAKAAS